MPYVVMQVGGAIAASAVVLLLYGSALTGFEDRHRIIRGHAGSEASAMIFAEYYPNPGGRPLPAGSGSLALDATSFLAEGAATALLLFVICALTDERRRRHAAPLTPAAIGLTVALLICLVGPLTMACLNPARDFGPRLFSSLAGWNAVPFHANGLGWLTVYIIAPISGSDHGRGAVSICL